MEEKNSVIDKTLPKRHCLCKDAKKNRAVCADGCAWGNDERVICVVGGVMKFFSSHFIRGVWRWVGRRGEKDVK
jgi:hypothetical protein